MNFPFKPVILTTDALVFLLLAVVFLVLAALGIGAARKALD